MEPCKQCGNAPARICGNVGCQYGQNPVSVEKDQKMRIDILVEIIEELEKALEEQPINSVPNDTWVLVTLSSTIHPEEKVYEVARFDTEYFDEPTWVCQHELEPIELRPAYKETGWRHLPS